MVSGWWLVGDKTATLAVLSFILVLYLFMPTYLRAKNCDTIPL